MNGEALLRVALMLIEMSGRLEQTSVMRDLTIERI